MYNVRKLRGHDAPWSQGKNPFLLFDPLLPSWDLGHACLIGRPSGFSRRRIGHGRHEGKVRITKEGCALVRKSDAKMPGGRLGLGLMFIQKLERRDRVAWVEMPVAPMRQKKLTACREGAG